VVPLKLGKHHQLICFHRQAGRKISNPLMSLVKRICRGSACTCQLLKFCSVINSRQPCAAFVNFLPSTPLFLLCIVGCFALLRLRASLVRFAVPHCPQRPNNLNASLRLVGLLGLYSHVGRQATGISLVKAGRSRNRFGAATKQSGNRSVVASNRWTGDFGHVAHHQRNL
jgi:hypothetical protein